VAELIMTVQVKDSGGRIVYVKTFTGQGTKSGVMLRSGGPAKAALDQALADGISKLFADQSLIEALTQAGKSDR